MKAKERIQALRAWLAAIAIIVPAVMLAESRSEVGSIVVQDGNTETAQLSAAESEAAQKAARKAARQTLRGYRGFVEAGGFFNIAVKNETYTFDNKIITEYSTDGDKVELSTTHGFQFNNYFFLGAGVALNYHINPEEAQKFALPIFIDARVNILNRKVSPTIGLKIGAAVGKDTGFYSASSIGCRIADSAKSAIVIGVEFYINEAVWRTPKTGLGLTVGYEF